MFATFFVFIIVCNYSGLLPGAVVEKGARVIKAIVGEETVICENACFCGGNEQNKIALIGNNDRFVSA